MLSRRNQTNKRKILLFIKLVLVLILGHLVIKMAVTPDEVRETLAPRPAGGSEMAVAADPSGVEQNQAEDYSALLERDLFGNGVSGRKTPEVARAVGSLSRGVPAQDELDIALVGTVAGSPAVSRAIIRNLETNVLGQYKTGDRILTASVELIERDRVVLLHNGRRWVLTMQAAESAPVGGNAGRAVARASVQPIQVAKTPVVATTFVDKLRQAAVMLPEATVEPHTVEGEVEGLKVSDLGEIDGAADLGLKDGDVIRAINGHRLNSKQKAFQIAMKARSQDALSVELQRDNKIRKFSLPLK